MRRCRQARRREPAGGIETASLIGSSTPGSNEKRCLRLAASRLPLDRDGEREGERDGSDGSEEREAESPAATTASWFAALIRPPSALGMGRIGRLGSPLELALGEDLALQLPQLLS